MHLVNYGKRQLVYSEDLVVPILIFVLAVVQFAVMIYLAVKLFGHVYFAEVEERAFPIAWVELRELMRLSRHLCYTTWQ